MYEADSDAGGAAQQTQQAGPSDQSDGRSAGSIREAGIAAARSCGLPRNCGRKVLGGRGSRCQDGGGRGQKAGKLKACADVS